MEPAKKKTLITILIILSGSFLVVISNDSRQVTAYQSTGIAIDFGNWEVTWTDADLNIYGNPFEALTYACDENGYNLIETDGMVTEINGVSNTEYAEWGLWIIERGSIHWSKLDLPYDDISGYAVVSWAYCEKNGIPTVGVDQYGRSIYGYPQARRVVTLSPSMTEIIGALNAVNTLVGTDGGYKGSSNYPHSVINNQKRGDIAIVGDFTNPSFELIIKTRPDVVFCDGSMYSHYEVSERIRKTSVNSIVMYAGTSMEAILNNIYIMGVVMGYELRSIEVISFLTSAEDEITRWVGSGNVPVDVMVALSPDKSPWVSGYGTYMDDILNTIMGKNVFSNSEYYGWVQVNSETVPRLNPSVIIITTDGYLATESEYEELLRSLSPEWKETDAYKNERIYVLCEGLGEMAQRPGPRYAQLMEIISLILHSPSDVPLFIGDDYTEYLTFTKHLGFNS